MSHIEQERKPLLRLRQMEMSLVRSKIAYPEEISDADYQTLRYVLNFAKLDRFSPGAALGTGARDDVHLADRIMMPFREQVLLSLFRVLRRGTDQVRRLTESAKRLPELRTALEATQAALLAHHVNDFSQEELEAEICHKVLVVAAGGGGGAGYVYFGALARLHEAGIQPSYLVGTSIGSLIGGFFASRQQIDPEALLAWAKTLKTSDAFATVKLARTYTLPGLMRLHLRGFQPQLVHADGSFIRLSETAIPYEAVIGGLRRKMYERLPAALRRLESPAHRTRRFSAQLAERMVQLSMFATPHLVKSIPLGRTTETRDIRMVDAMGISSAIPGVLQYEPPHRDDGTDAVLQQLQEEHDLVTFMDGGVVNNVPAKTAWEGVASGRIGTRNAFYLALDCFHPQFDPKHAWLWPVTTAIQLQLPANRNYHDWLIRFEPTLSPINLIPDELGFDNAWSWGHTQMSEIMLYVQEALRPISWRVGMNGSSGQ